MEQVVYDDGTGQLLTASFMEYAMPRADTFCDMAIESNPVPTKLRAAQRPQTVILTPPNRPGCPMAARPCLTAAEDSATRSKGWTS